MSWSCETRSIHSHETEDVRLGDLLLVGRIEEMTAARHTHTAAERWTHLERAHILSQPIILQHLRVHTMMFGLALRTRDAREAAGQLARLGRPGWVGLTGDDNDAPAYSLVTAFALVREVRQFFDGPIALSGAITDGNAILAAENRDFYSDPGISVTGTRSSTTPEESIRVSRCLSCHKAAGVRSTMSITSVSGRRRETRASLTHPYRSRRSRIPCTSTTISSTAKEWGEPVGVPGKMRNWLQTEHGVELKEADNFISSAQVQTKTEEVLGLKAQLQALERQQAAHRREIGALEAKQRELPLSEASEQGEIERELAELAQESAENEALRRIVVRAPQDGTVTALSAEPGQSVGAQAVLVGRATLFGVMAAGMALCAVAFLLLLLLTPTSGLALVILALLVAGVALLVAGGVEEVVHEQQVVREVGEREAGIALAELVVHDHRAHRHLAGRRPEWARNKPGCSALSCSS